MGIMKQCRNCDETMMVCPSLEERKKYCSKDCMNDWWRGKRRSPQQELFGKEV